MMKISALFLPCHGMDAPAFEKKWTDEVKDGGKCGQLQTSEALKQARVDEERNIRCVESVDHQIQ